MNTSPRKTMTTTKARKRASALKLHQPKPCWAATACPFCGWVPSIQGWHGAKVLISCDAEQCHVNPSASGETRRQALTRWNKRVPKPHRVARTKAAR